MTVLTKPVRRRARVQAPHGITPELIITLYPGGVIGLREARRRREYQVSAGFLYARLVAQEVYTGRISHAPTDDKERAPAFRNGTLRRKNEDHQRD